MASFPTHAAVGAGLSLAALGYRTSIGGYGLVIAGCAALAVLPDADTLPLFLGYANYGSFFGHRGFFHSPFFLVLLSILLAGWRVAARGRSLREAAPLAAVWSLAAISHPVLDAMTDGGRGVMMWFPFSGERVFFPWRPIHVSPIGISSFFDSAGYILSSEWPFVIAAILLGLAGRLVFRDKT